ncbi:MAG: AEC family transporter [Verrucomicrobiota bacterium]
MSSFLSVLTAVLPIFGVIVLGLMLRRGRVLTREADQSLLRVVINVLIPCLIWDSILGNPALDNPSNTWLPPLIGFSTVAVGIGVAYFMSRVAGLSANSHRRSFALSGGIYNWAYLAYPICALLFGKEVVGVLFVYNLGVEICMWTLGIWVISGQKLRESWCRVINGPVIAIITALVFNALDADFWLPDFALTGISLIGASAIPLGLLLVGATFWDHLGEADILRHPRVGGTALLVRLLFMPVIMLGIAWWLPASMELKTVLIVQAAMPSAVFPVVLAQHYGGHVPTALRVVLWTSLCGLITMPLWIHLGLQWFGIEVGR